MQDIQNDILKLQELYNHAKQVTQDRDLKLQTLTNIISNKIQNPINTNNKKIIIFTAFADTAMYLYESISKEFLKHNIHSCLITGSGNNKTTFDTKDKDLNSLLTHFSPVSKEREKIDHLIIHYQQDLLEIQKTQIDLLENILHNVKKE
jgi:ERCC4-related helicase